MVKQIRMVKKINCLVCGNPITIPLPNIDPDNYDGQLFCHKCNLLLHIKTEASKVKKYNVVPNQTINVKSDIKVISAVPRPDYSKKSEDKARDL